VPCYLSGSLWFYNSAKNLIWKDGLDKREGIYAPLSQCTGLVP
jgi:hypothetical protein